MIQRSFYMNILRTYRDIPLVKILPGVRGSGKSSILSLLKSDLLKNGVPEDHIITMRCLSGVFGDMMTHKELYNRVKAQFVDGNRYYLLLDEVQEIAQWERAVNSLLENANTDIYVAGSSTRLLPREISTYLIGRYILVPVYPLSFAEFVDFKSTSRDKAKLAFKDYLQIGGFPLVASASFDEMTILQVVEGIYGSILIREILSHHKITNFALFNSIVRYIIDNVGTTFSANAIVKFIKRKGQAVSVEAVYNYLDWLEKAFVIFRCQRYDLQSKTVLKTQSKFYLAEVSLLYGILNTPYEELKSQFKEAILENIVYFELRRRGYTVYIGKNATKEIDFVAVRRDERIYIQVCRRLPDDSDREIANLLEINDHYHKYVVTLDELAAGNTNGVKIVHIADFLLSSEY